LAEIFTTIKLFLPGRAVVGIGVAEVPTVTVPFVIDILSGSKSTLSA